MINEELVEKLPKPWVMQGTTYYKGIHYFIYVNPETGDEELWKAEAPNGEAIRVHDGATDS